MIIVSRDLVDDLHLLQIGKVSIHRTLRQSRSTLQKFRNGCRAPELQEQVDQLTSASGIHPTGLSQSLRHLVVHRLAVCLHCDERT
jgi:hypothetical protein